MRAAGAEIHLDVLGDGLALDDLDSDHPAVGVVPCQAHHAEGPLADFRHELVLLVRADDLPEHIFELSILHRYALAMMARRGVGLNGSGFSTRRAAPDGWRSAL
jgi:hypothetical protein